MFKTLAHACACEAPRPWRHSNVTRGNTKDTTPRPTMAQFASKKLPTSTEYAISGYCDKLVTPATNHVTPIVVPSVLNLKAVAGRTAKRNPA